MVDFELKKWDKSYTKDIAICANNKKIADNLRNVFPYPYEYKDAENYIISCMENNEEKQMCRAIVIDNTAVGSIGIFQKNDVYCKSAELGYWLAEDYWGKGIMSSAIKQICTTAFEQYDIVRIFAEPYAYNIGSRRALEKAGFVLEGILKRSIYKNENFLDSCIYALLK